MGKRWNRKRKTERKNETCRKSTTEQARTEYVPAVQSNVKMEAYYTLQGLHNTRLCPESRSFIPCKTDEEKEKERLRWLQSLRSILPASFRIGQDMDDIVRSKIEEELNDFVGKEVEIWVDVEEGRGYNGPDGGCRGGSKEEKVDEEEEVKVDEKEEKVVDVDEKMEVVVDGGMGAGNENKASSSTEAGTPGPPPSNVSATGKGKTNVEANNKTNDGGDDPKSSSTTTTTGAGAEQEEAAEAAPAAASASTSKQSPPNLIKKKLSPAVPIPFIPHAYQLSVDRRTLRRNPGLTPFHNWMKIQTDAGFITRQETVSMITPVVLNPQRHHTVLDMCAAPGSKTCQLLEIVSDIQKDELECEGCVVANDSDPKRAYMLVHQLRRMNSPNVLVTSCDAQLFPMLKSMEMKEKGEEGMFDRVLCDVPCSGDGTTRKNPGIWKHWNQLGALALHPLQLGIALNGLRLTKVGGYMCYSTCAMNPIENEAVVCELLRLLDGCVELVDKRQDMPNLMARPGWTTWKVLHEEKSRREKKNYEKKNNAKMRERRRVWAEKRRREEGGEEEGKGGTAGGDEKKKLRSAEEDGNTAGDAEEGKKDNGNVKPMEEEEAKGEENTNGGPNGKAATTAEAEAAEPMKVDNNKKENNDTAGANGNTEDAAQPNNDPTGNPTNNGAAAPSFLRDLGPPPSWDQTTLQNRAKSVGFIEYPTYESVPEQWRKRVRKSCFPPTQDEISKFHLDRCMRCLPHDMDTGGFFVTLFRKVKPLSKRARERAERLAKELRKDEKGEDDNEGVANDVQEEGGGATGKDPPAEPPNEKETKAKQEKNDAVDDDDDGADAMEGVTPSDDQDATTSADGTSANAATTSPDASEKDSEMDSNIEDNTTTTTATPTTTTATDAEGGTGVDKGNKEDAETKGKSDDSSNNNNPSNPPTKKIVKGKPLLRGRSKTRGDIGNEDFIPLNESIWSPLIDFYGLSPTTFPKDQYMARASGDAKVLYFISKSIKTKLIDCGIQNRVTVINSGLKGFERNNKDCEVKYRITQEGIHFLAPHMNKRKVVASFTDFEKCIAGGGIKFDTFTESFVEKVKPLTVGSFVVALDGYENDVFKKMFLVMWRCRGDALNCLVAKVEMEGMRSKLRALAGSNKGDDGADEKEVEEGTTTAETASKKDT